jgi:hypothetical protein
LSSTVWHSREQNAPGSRAGSPLIPGRAPRDKVTAGGLREASAAYVLVDTSTYKEKKFSADVVHKQKRDEILSRRRVRSLVQKSMPGDTEGTVIGTTYLKEVNDGPSYHRSSRGVSRREVGCTCID